MFWIQKKRTLFSVRFKIELGFAGVDEQHPYVFVSLGVFEFLEGPV